MKLHRNDSERGQSLVEFGLIIPIVLLIMFGLFDLGRVVFINNSLSDGARNGARHASVGPATPTTALRSTMPCAARPAVSR